MFWFLNSPAMRPTRTLASKNKVVLGGSKSGFMFWSNSSSTLPGALLHYSTAPMKLLADAKASVT